MLCQLYQEVGSYGRVEFADQSGRGLKVKVIPVQPAMVSEKVVLRQKPAPWDHAAAEKVLVEFDVEKKRLPLYLDDEKAQMLLDSLEAGRYAAIDYTDVTHTHRAKTVSVALNAIGFQQAYKQFQQCQGDMLSYTFDDIRDTELQFATNASVLTQEMQRQIDKIVNYLKAADGEFKIKVSGHTDSIARKRYNHELSKKRAKSVVDYLVSKAIPTEAIATHTYGEQKPKQSNRTAAGRAANRRVEILVSLYESR